MSLVASPEPDSPAVRRHHAGSSHALGVVNSGPGLADTVSGARRYSELVNLRGVSLLLPGAPLCVPLLPVVLGLPAGGTASGLLKCYC